MSLIIDLIIIIAAIVCVYHGIMRGFVKSIMGFASIIIAVAIAYFFTGDVAEWLNNAFIGEWTANIVNESITGIINAGSEKLALDKIFTDRPETLNDIAARFGADLDAIAKYYYEALASSAEPSAVQALSHRIAEPTATAISTVLSAAGIFFASLLALKLLTLLLDAICRLPVLNKLNKLLGALFGIASACVCTWVIANLAVGAILAFESIDPNVFNKTIINGTVILKFFCENGWIAFQP